MEIADVLTTTNAKKVRKRGIALTSEHGSWGMLFEPLVASVAVAHSRTAIWILLLVLGAFMMRQPLKILLTNLFAGRDLPQNGVALRFALMYGSVFLLGFGGSVIMVDPMSLLPFALAAPFAVFQVKSDASGKGRNLMPELAGSLAISSSAAVISLDAGWAPLAAFSLWAVLALRSVTSVFYVRNRLRLEKGKPYTYYGVILIHIAAAGLIAVLAGLGLASNLTLAVFVLLLLRAAVGISRYHRPIKAMKIGIWEVVYGLLTVTSIIVGYYLEI